MNIISRFLVVCLLMQSFAWASPKEDLRTVLDDYHYALTVEWDQKDQAQLASYKSHFSQELKRLVQEEQLSAEEFADFIKENHRELKLDENILDLVKDQNGELDLARAQFMLEEGSKHIYGQGSSWAPEEVLLYGFLTLLVFEIVVLIVTARDDVCPNPTRYPNEVPFECIYE